MKDVGLGCNGRYDISKKRDIVYYEDFYAESLIVGGTLNSTGLYIARITFTVYLSSIFSKQTMFSKLRS